MRSGTFLHLAPVALFVAACDINQSQFVDDVIPGVPSVPDFGALTPVPVADDATPDGLLADIQSNVLYAEIGPTGTSFQSGATASFLGTGGSLCILLDPELVSWVQSVSPTSPLSDFAYPDNIYDDGDLEIRVGQSVFYTGTTGQRLGNFQIRFEDSLGVETTQDKNACVYQGQTPDFPVQFGGRAAFEACTVENTIPGTSYTIALEGFALPVDDARLGFGLVVIEGACTDLSSKLGGTLDDNYARECIIPGEAILPGSPRGARAEAAGFPDLTWLGADEVPTWPGALDFEQSFCNISADVADRDKLAAYCKREIDAVVEEATTCSWELPPSLDASDAGARRCFCGDLADTPTGGGI
ncbi:MAG: hypothetical protein RLZZ383_2384 [Pseudomonadota bacterium]|jgi:hypothetical protein